MKILQQCNPVRNNREGEPMVHSFTQYQIAIITLFLVPNFKSCYDNNRTNYRNFLMMVIKLRDEKLTFKVNEWLCLQEGNPVKTDFPPSGKGSLEKQILLIWSKFFLFKVDPFSKANRQS